MPAIHIPAPNQFLLAFVFSQSPVWRRRDDTLHRFIGQRNSARVGANQQNITANFAILNLWWYDFAAMGIFYGGYAHRHLGRIAARLGGRVAADFYGITIGGWNILFRQGYPSVRENWNCLGWNADLFYCASACLLVFALT